MLRFRILVACVVLSAAWSEAAGQTPPPGKDIIGDPLPPFAAARLGTIRWRHDDVIRFAAFLPDGKRIVSVAADQTIKVWEFPSGKELRRISLAEATGPEMLVVPPSFGGSTNFAVALSKDGKVIATYFQTLVLKKAQGGPQIRLHEVDTGKELPALRLNSQDVTSLIFSPNGEHLISIHNSAPARLWDWAKGQELRRFTIPGKEGDPGISGLLIKGGSGTFLVGPDSQDDVVYSPDGNALMRLTQTNTLRFVDVGTGKEIGADGHATAVQSVQFSANGSEIVTRAADGSMRKWDAATGKDFGPIVKSSTKSAVSSAGNPRKVNLAASPDGSIIVGTSLNQAQDKALTLTDSATGNELATLKLEYAGPRQAEVVFSPGNKLLAVVSAVTKAMEDPRLELFDVGTGKRLHTFILLPNPAQPKQKGNVRSARTLLFSPDGQTMAWGIDGKTITIWDIATGKRTSSVPLPSGATNDNVAFTPDGRCLAFEMDDGTVLLYEWAAAGPRWAFGQPMPKGISRPAVVTRVLPAVAQNQLHAGCRIAVSPDGKSLAMAASDRVVRVWDIATGRELVAFKGHTASLNAVAFSPDSKLVASASADTTALVWDFSKVERPAPLVKLLLPADIEQCWQVLATNDGGKAFAAICDLTTSPKESVAWIKESVKPTAAVEMKRIDELIAQLDDNQFKVREKATGELYKIGEPIVPALEKALAGNLTLETKRRLEEIRNRLTTRVLQGDRLRNYRAIEVLERIGTPEARQVLEELAAGAPGTLLTTSAQAALKR
jgi:WD40 repeat protein